MLVSMESVLDIVGWLIGCALILGVLVMLGAVVGDGFSGGYNSRYDNDT